MLKNAINFSNITAHELRSVRGGGKKRIKHFVILVGRSVAQSAFCWSLMKLVASFYRLVGGWGGVHTKRAL